MRTTRGAACEAAVPGPWARPNVTSPLVLAIQRRSPRNISSIPRNTSPLRWISAADSWAVRRRGRDRSAPATAARPKRRSRPPTIPPQTRKRHTPVRHAAVSGVRTGAWAPCPRLRGHVKRDRPAPPTLGQAAGGHPRRAIPGGQSPPCRPIPQERIQLAVLHRPFFLSSLVGWVKVAERPQPHQSSPRILVGQLPLRGLDPTLPLSALIVHPFRPGILPAVFGAASGPCGAASTWWARCTLRPGPPRGWRPLERPPSQSPTAGAGPASRRPR